MPPIAIAPGIHWIGVNDRTTGLFEGLWPIHREGISYNAYLIDDDKKVLIDLAKAFKTDEFLEQIDQVCDPARLDVIVVNHVEPDHTGILSTLRRIAPRAEVLATPKAIDMLRSFYTIGEDARVVEDGETLDTGAHTLRFVHTPFVHWPETMMTYEASQQVLFSCDGFGGYGALQGALFDDEYKDLAFYEREALRYFANIVASFSRPTLNAIAKLADVPLSVVAPSHGLVWRKNPARIVELYEQWAGYAQQPGDPSVTLLYGSMYGQTERMMNAVAQGISSKGVPVEIFDAADTHASYILPSLWTRQGVAVGAPTYENALYPLVAQVLELARVKRIRNRTCFRFGSYGWSGGAGRHFEQLVEPLKWNLWDTFEFQGAPTEADLRKGEAQGAAFAEALLQETAESSDAQTNA